MINNRENIRIITSEKTTTTGLARLQNQEDDMLRITLWMTVAVRGETVVAGEPTIRETFSVFYGGDFLEKVVFFTNRYANSFVEQSADGWYAQRWKDTDMTTADAISDVYA